MVLSYREVEFTLPRFIVILSAPALIYVYSSIVVPSDPSAVGSWRDYFYSVRVSLLATHFLLMVVVLFSNNVFLGTPVFGVASLPVQVLIVVSGVGLLSANPRLHTLLALGPPTLAVITVLMVAQPGSLTP